MRRKTFPFLIVLCVIGIPLTLVSGLVVNAIDLPLVLKPYAWPLLIGIILVLTAIAIWQILLQRETESVSLTNQSRMRQRLLAKVRAFWISNFLEKSIYHQVHIELNLQGQSEAFMNSWRDIFQESEQSSRQFPMGYTISQIYDDGGGELLILGAPGAGKTTLLLELARDLLDRADKDEKHLMPVVFNLSTWGEKSKSLIDWMLEELKRRYQVSPNLGRAWIEDDQILLLLDGLDEVDVRYREKCVEAINDYRKVHGLVPLVVCCREKDYLSFKTPLLIYNSVAVQPLTTKQVDAFLSNFGEQSKGLRTALGEDTELRELATTPLMLNVLILAYISQSSNDALNADPVNTQQHFSFFTTYKSSLNKKQQQVFEYFVYRMLNRRGSSKFYSFQQTITWLAWIVQRSGVSIGKDIFRAPFPKWIQKRWQYWTYDLCSIFLVLIWIFSALIPLVLLVLRLIYISLVLPIVVIYLLWHLVLSCFKYITAAGDRAKAEEANYRIKIFLRGWLLMIVLLFIITLNWQILFLASMPLIDFTIGLILVNRLLDIIVRFFLYSDGCMPWNYKHFLDFLTEHLLLRKVGDSYIFIHSLLYEYFASLETMPMRDEKEKAKK